jgi:RimJ/RimL family protein N-acetyltransferase
MEAMPYRDDVELQQRSAKQTQSSVVESDWRAGLPTLLGSNVMLRELRASDAASLFAMLSTDEVSRFISPPPTSVEGFERFIAWTLRRRSAGDYICFGVVPRGSDAAIGLFQIRACGGTLETAEWGFVIGSGYWGTGVFVEGAKLVLDFAFTALEVHRLEARAAVLNGRGNAALHKLGAVREGVLRRSLLRRGEYLDQNLWAILDSDWLTLDLPQGPWTIH